MITLDVASWSDGNDTVLHLQRHEHGVTLTVRIRGWLFDTGLSMLRPEEQSRCERDAQLWEVADVLSGAFAASSWELKDLLEEAVP